MFSKSSLVPTQTGALVTSKFQNAAPLESTSIFLSLGGTMPSALPKSISATTYEVSHSPIHSVVPFLAATLAIVPLVTIAPHDSTLSYKRRSVTALSIRKEQRKITLNEKTEKTVKLLNHSMVKKVENRQ